MLNLFPKTIEYYPRHIEAYINCAVNLLDLHNEKDALRKIRSAYQIDRENEKFTKEALEKLSKLFLGKTGVMDHEAKAKNQSARIYYCEVEKVDGKTTKDNKQYFRLKAKAYMPKSEKNKD